MKSISINFFAKWDSKWGLSGVLGTCQLVNIINLLRYQLVLES